MTPERWQKVKEICYAVLDREPEVRAALLNELCANDAELMRDVTAMMADASQQDSRLHAPAWELIGLRVDGVGIDRNEGVRADWIPDAIGTYRILRLVGEGGMGVVYEAQQVEPDRRVALKVVKPGLATPEVLRRFRQESQALGRLQHPGIAQIYEAGTADSGFGPQPYFAMEFIRGESLTDYAATHHLNVAQRLELIAGICDAVDHAHQRGLIHRDLKPANILIDASGQPKVLDFGVARVTDSDVQRTQQTDLGQLVGTLAYMSPEQVLADPLELDTRSDVYSLGVILYELLAGCLPYEISRRVHEAVRTIQQEDPKRLSSISRIYRGDLETIAAKALEKEKSRRYGSAGALAADIRRHLHDEPIAARPPSASYHLRKFARRHKAMVAGVVAVFVVLTAGIVATTREAIRARHAEQAAVIAEQTMQAVNAFLRDDLLAQASANTQAGPRVKPDPDLRVRTALDRAAAQVGDKFATRPAVEAAIRRTIGRTYRDLGLYPEAQAQLERSFTLSRTLLGGTHPDLLDVIDELANLYYQQGKYDLAEPLAIQILEIRRRTSGEDGPETLLAMNNLGLIYGFEGKDALAAALLAQALEARRRVSGEMHQATHTVMMNLAQVYDRQGKDAEAETLYVRALAIAREVKGEEHPETLTNMNNLSTVYRDQGKWAQAESLLDATLAIRRRILGDNHPNTLTTTNNLGNLYLDQGKVAEAEALFKPLLETRIKVLGESHPNTLMTMNNLARVFRFRGGYAEAVGLLGRALEIQRKVLGPEHPDTLLVMSNLAFLQSYAGQSEQAKATLNQVLDIRKRVSGPEHPDTIFELERLGLVSEKERQYARAEELFTTVVSTSSRVLGEQHRDTLRARTSLGRVQLTQRKFDNAARTLTNSLATYQKVSPDSWQRYSCQSLLGASLAGQKQYPAAERELLSGYEGMTRLRPTIPMPERHYLDDAARALSDVYRQTGRLDLALEWSRKR